MASKPEAIRVSARYLTDSGRKAGKCKKDAGRDAGKPVSPPYPIRKKKWTQDHKILTTGFGGGGQARSAQGSAHDSKDTRHHGKDVHGPMGHRGPNLARDPPVRERGGVLRSSRFHPDLRGWIRKQKEIKGAIQSPAKKR
jgi:hypothetical protein